MSNLSTTRSRASPTMESRQSMAESENTMQLYAPQDTIAFSVRHPPLNRTKRNPSPRPLHRFPSSELSVAIDGFPNTLMIGGPNSEVGKVIPRSGLKTSLTTPSSAFNKPNSSTLNPWPHPRGLQPTFPLRQSLFHKRENCFWRKVPDYVLQRSKLRAKVWHCGLSASYI